jgi:hypothetical protein
MVEPLTERERDLILLALMKAGPSDEAHALLTRLSDPAATLCLQRDRRSRPKPKLRAVP